ncbi:MAG: YncE family protein, partial [Melioribacteraceae bacterium]|nr:YncE family protein [Melioribacteraceae bacterium]
SLNEAPYTTPSSYRVYCCNSGDESISVIDGTEYVVGRVVDLDEDQALDASPYWVEEYGNYYYVTLDKAGSLLKFRKSDNALVGRIDNLISPGLIRINLDGSKAYVSRSLNSTSIFNSIYVINISNMTIASLINLPVNGLPHGMALDLTRAYLYVADALSNVIYVINTLTDFVIDLKIQLQFDYLPLFIELPPYGTYIYVTTQGINSLQAIAANNRLIEWVIPLKSNPRDIAVTTDGQKIFVASSGGNVVEIITRVTNFWSKTGEISHPAFSMPFGIDITVDDRYLFVSNINTNGAFTPAFKVRGEGNISTVGIINVQTESVIKVIEVEENASAIVVERNLN